MTQPQLHPLYTPNGHRLDRAAYRLVDDGVGYRLEVGTGPLHDTAWHDTMMRYAYRAGVREDALDWIARHYATLADRAVTAGEIAHGQSFPGNLYTVWSPVNQAWLITWGQHRWAPVLSLQNTAEECADYLNFLLAEVK